MVCIFHASPETRAHGFESDLYRTWPDPVFTLSLLGQCEKFFRDETHVFIFVFYTSQNDFVRYRREWISWIGAQNKIKSTIV